MVPGLAPHAPVAVAFGQVALYLMAAVTASFYLRKRIGVFFQVLMNDEGEDKVDLSGATLYGTTANGGTSSKGTVFSISTNGSGFATGTATKVSCSRANPRAGTTMLRRMGK